MLRNLKWIGTLLAGLVLGIISFWLFIKPVTFLNYLCIERPCAAGLIVAGIALLVSLSIIAAGVVLFVRSRQTQTVTIAINEEAEADAQAIGEIEKAIERNENAEKKIGKVETHKERIDLEKFIELPKEEFKIKRKK